jgi:hypothetical protein
MDCIDKTEDIVWAIRGETRSSGQTISGDSEMLTLDKMVANPTCSDAAGSQPGEADL